MWLSSVFLRSLRGYRVGLLGWGIGMGLVVLSTMATVGSLVNTPQARQQLVTLAGTFAWNADVVAVDTVGGYVTWKIGIFMLLIAIWPVLAASRTLRGEEERGSLDALLALPRGRLRTGVEKVAGLWAALLGACLVVAVLVYAGGQRFGADFGFGGALLFGLNLALVCAVMGGVALLVSQFTLERAAAASWSGGLLVLFVVLDMVHRVLPGLGWLSHLSPVYYYNLSKPLVPSFGVNGGAMLGLLGLALALTGGALWLFAGRDIGGLVQLGSGQARASVSAQCDLPEGSWPLGSVFGRGLSMLLPAAAWWTIGIAAFGAWIIVVVQQTTASLNSLVASSPAVATALKGLGADSASITTALLSALFVLLPIFLMAFAVTQVSRWAADEEEGRLEMVLATPQRRLGVLFGRFGALALAVVAMAIVAWLATGAAAAATGLPIGAGKLAAAALGMIPLGLLLAALGYLASGWLRTAADTGLLSFVLLAWFFLGFVGPELGWPSAALRLSPFYDYGQPLLHGLPVGPALAMLGIAAAALALSALRFARKDIRV